MKFTSIKATPDTASPTFTVTAAFEIDGRTDSAVVNDVLNPNHPQAGDGDFRNAERAAVTRLESYLSTHFDVTPDEVKGAAESYFGIHSVMGGR